MNSSCLPETCNHYPGPLMYPLIEQEKWEGVFINGCPDLKEVFIGDSCSLSPLRLEQGNGA